MKKCLFLALGLFLGPIRVSGMQHMIKAGKGLVTLSAAAIPWYAVDEFYAAPDNQEMQAMPDLDPANAAYIKDLLIKKGPKNLDQELMAKMQFKQRSRDEGPFAGVGPAASGDRSMPMMTTSVPVEDFPDMAYLHELGHIYHNDSPKQEFYRKIHYSALIMSSMYYMLKKPSLKRFLIVPLAAWKLADLSVPAVQNIIAYDCESAADDFAIDCLKYHKDVLALKDVARSLHEYADKMDEYHAEIEKDGDAGERLMSRFMTGPSFIRAQFDVHPPVRERAQKCEIALKELEDLK